VVADKLVHLPGKRPVDLILDAEAAESPNVATGRFFVFGYQSPTEFASVARGIGKNVTT
jgi:hypothetical protein